MLFTKFIIILSIHALAGFIFYLKELKKFQWLEWKLIILAHNRNFFKSYLNVFGVILLAMIFGILFILAWKHLEKLNKELLQRMKALE